MAHGRAVTSRRVNWFLVIPGVLLLGLAAALGYAPLEAYDSSCGGVLNDPSYEGPCAGVHSGLTVAIGVMGVVGLGLVVFGLARRIGGVRLVVAGFLVGGIWSLSVAGTSLTVHRDDCGSLTTPASWTGYPVPVGPWHPQGCPGRLDSRRLEVVALYGTAMVLLVGLVVVVLRVPAEPKAADLSVKHLEAFE